MEHQSGSPAVPLESARTGLFQSSYSLHVKRICSSLMVLQRGLQLGKAPHLRVLKDSTDLAALHLVTYFGA
jgi:hypothetical protein